MMSDCARHPAWLARLVGKISDPLFLFRNRQIFEVLLPVRFRDLRGPQVSLGVDGPGALEDVLFVVPCRVGFAFIITAAQSYLMLVMTSRQLTTHGLGDLFDQPEV